MSLSDQEVFMRWAGRRDAEAFSELVRRYAGIVFATCRRVLRNESDAEEITQDCFEQLVLFSGKPPIHPAAWLHGMATNKSLMRMRAEERRRRREQEYAVLRANAHEVTWNDIAGFVDAAIHELPEAVRAPVVMHFLGGKTHAAIAEEMGIPRRTVSNRIERGVELLGESLRHRGLTLTGASLGVFLFTHLSEAETLPETVTAALEKLALAHAAGSPITASGLLGGIFGAKQVAAATLVVVALAAAIGINKIAYAPRSSGDPATPAVSQMEGEKTEGDTESFSSADANASSLVDLFHTSAGIAGNVLDKTMMYRPEQLAAVQFSTPEEWGDNNKVGEAIVKAKVIEEANKPLSGVLVVAKGEGIVRTAVSDENGRYHIDKLKPGSYGVHAECPSGAIVGGDHSVQSQDVSVQPFENKTNVDFSFRFNGLTITGHVKDTAGKPIEGAAIEVKRNPEWLGQYNDSYMEPLLGITDSEGFFQMTGLAPMDILSAGKYLHNGGTESEVIYGLYARAKGYGPAGIGVVAISENLERQAEIWLTELLKLQERSGAGRPEDMVVRAPDVFLPPSTGDTITGIDFVLESGALVSGRVIDTRGVSVAEKHLSMGFERRPETPQAVKCVPIQPKGVTTDAEGRFSFIDVAPQTYVFNVGREHDYQRTRNDPLQVNAGDHIENLQLVVESLADRGQISGMLVDAVTGNPLRNASVKLSKLESPIEKNPITGEKEVDAERGTFIIRNITPGTAILESSAEGYSMVETPVEIMAGDNPPITVKLPPGGIIEGTISFNGEPIKGSVSARRADGQELLMEHNWNRSYVTMDTDPSGNFFIKRLPGAQYYVQMDAAPYEDASIHVTSLGQVGVVAGQTARLDLNAVSGTATIRGTFIPSDLHRKGFMELLAGEWQGCDWDNPDEKLQHWLAIRAKRDEISKRVEFEFSQLLPGTYTLHAECYYRKDEQEESLSERPQIWRVIKVQEGAALEIILEFPSSEFE
ncbi:MAG TPA: sigma-70 family RNA polymerase sigma factor [Candidatus Hydrogenedentes bacterium]|nr:sigma-70 family RNA polymerase sigma factor [Candidatus Hydrogenedentota bacterium]